jgi:hypothetical protein
LSGLRHVFGGSAPRVVDSDTLINAGFAIHRTGEGGFGYKISSPAGIFTAELTALFETLRHIGKVIQPPERCLILTDDLSSVKISHRTHPLVYECEQMCSNLLCNGIEVEIMWIPFHEGLEGTQVPHLVTVTENSELYPVITIF